MQISNEDLADRAKALELFRRSYRKNEAMEDNKILLKEKYQKGKELGIMTGQHRDAIRQLTNKME